MSADTDRAARGLILAFPLPMTLHGGINTLTHRRIVGWAWESGAPDVPVTVLVTIGSRVLARCSADLYREDLEIEGYAQGLCGFEVRLPLERLSPREAYEISVRREGDGAHLPGSPYALEQAIKIVRET